MSSIYYTGGGGTDDIGTPERVTTMSITIEEVCRFLELAKSIPWEKLTPSERAGVHSASLAISKHEELETLRAQLAEKDAMLGKCVEVLKDIDLERYFSKESPRKEAHQKMEYMAGRAHDFLASLPTTNQGVIAKVRDEALEEAAKAVAKMPLPSEYADTSLMAAVFTIRALKTEVK
jgi:hypothetical protein